MKRRDGEQSNRYRVGANCIVISTRRSKLPETSREIQVPFGLLAEVEVEPGSVLLIQTLLAKAIRPKLFRNEISMEKRLTSGNGIERVGSIHPKFAPPTPRVLVLNAKRDLAEFSSLMTKSGTGSTAASPRSSRNIRTCAGVNLTRGGTRFPLICSRAKWSPLLLVCAPCTMIPCALCQPRDLFDHGTAGSNSEESLETLVLRWGKLQLE